MSPDTRVGVSAQATKTCAGAVDETLLALDELLFAPRAWFALDAGNKKVPGVIPGTLREGLSLVGQGSVATIVGRLRKGVVAVDIDAGGRLAEAGVIAADTITDWCAQRRLWHLVRESGGGRGRAHVIVHAGAHADDLRELVAGLRRTLHLPGTRLDVRQALRPLSAPHRRTGPTAAPAGAEEALAALEGVLGRQAPPTARVKKRAPRQREVTGVVPAEPVARRRRDLPDGWARYVEDGAAPGGGRGDRSQVELEATFQLVICGHTAATAWQTIAGSHHAAFTKAKERGQSWWWTVWNAAVAQADAWHAEHIAPLLDGTRPDGASTSSTGTRQALMRVWARVCRDWLTWDAATRHTDLEVAATLVERAMRFDELAIGVPERDLVLACARSSRTTVRASLRRLADAGVLTRQPTYVQGSTDTSHTIVFPAIEEPSQEPEVRAVSFIAPPSVSQPLPQRPPLPTRRGLGSLRLVTVLWTLTSTPHLTLPEVAEKAGLLRDGQLLEELTKRQLRTVAGHLRVLAEHGLAVVDAGGRWSATTSASQEVTEVGTQIQEVVDREVAAEREEFRDVVEVDRRRARWEAQRQVAIAISRKADLARRRQWWQALPEGEREERSARHAEAFAQLSPREQAAAKRRWAATRASGGASERDRYEAWRTSLSPAELAERAGQRAAAFAGKPAEVRRELATAWAMHRKDWGLPEPAAPALLPVICADDTLTRREDDVEQLALFELEPTTKPVAVPVSVA